MGLNELRPINLQVFGHKIHKKNHKKFKIIYETHAIMQTLVKVKYEIRTLKTDRFSRWQVLRHTLSVIYEFLIGINSSINSGEVY